MEYTETATITTAVQGTERYAGFLDLLGRTFNEQSRQAVMEAFEMARTALDGMVRYDGTPLFDHSVRTAEIVISEIGLGRNSTISTLLHDVARLGLADADEIEKRFGSIPVSILEGLNLISKVHTKVSMSQADNFRDLIVSYSTDPRIILIKLADRLEVMRSLAMFPEGKQRKKSWESMNLYAQIAHKLGPLFHQKRTGGHRTEIPRTGRLRLHQPQAGRDRGRTRRIHRRIRRPDTEKARRARYPIPHQGTHQIGLLHLAEDETHGSIFRRSVRHLRHPHHRGVSDRERKALCWSIYSIVTDFYTPNPDRMRDWISIPKSNGYESLHTTVVTKDGHWVEIQIRSERMDEVAERGIAAHWRYKGVHGSGSRNDEWLARLREIMEESTNKSQIANKIDTESTSEEVFVFTPAGDLRKLPKGSHGARFRIRHPHPCGSRLYRCEDRRTQRLHQGRRLHNGDIVNIITAKTQKPKADWLNYVVTAKARNKIKACLREEEAKVARFGREDLERKLKKLETQHSD